MISKLMVLAVSTALMWTVSAANAAPVAFSFTQSGFAEGAEVTGTFAGEDIDMDGQLSSFQGEVTNLSVSFSGNSIISAFALDSSSAFWAVVYDLNNGPLGDANDGDIEGIVIFNGAFSYQSGAGPSSVCVGTNVCGAVSQTEVGRDESLDLVAVTATAASEPATVVGIVAGFLGLGLTRRRTASR
jgi:hypothetical protein